MVKIQTDKENQGGNMMPNFIHTRVDPSRLISTASNINENIRVVEKAISKAQSALSDGGGGSLRSTWTGPASEKFYSKYEVDLEEFKVHLQALKTLNTQLIEAAGYYDDANNNAQELVNRLRIV